MRAKPPRRCPEKFTDKACVAALLSAGCGRWSCWSKRPWYVHFTGGPGNERIPAQHGTLHAQRRTAAVQLHFDARILAGDDVLEHAALKHGVWHGMAPDVPADMAFGAGGCGRAGRKRGTSVF